MPAASVALQIIDVTRGETLWSGSGGKSGWSCEALSAVGQAPIRSLLNIIFTALTLLWGAALYGHGFTLAVLITLITGLIQLSRRLNRLEYETFMLQ